VINISHYLFFTIYSSFRHSIVVNICNTNHNRMPERREDCKKQISSNTNHNRMPERRENCKKQIVSNTLFVFYSSLFFPAFYCG
jgi:hypothetical protein